MESSSESKKLISNLLVTCHYCDKYDDTSVFFSVEKPITGHFKRISLSLVILLLFLSFDFSPFFAVLCIFIFTFLILTFSCTTRKESVHLSVPIGLQIKAVFLLGNKTSTFIPWSSIQDFLIVEVISRHTVIYCLIVVIEDLNGVSYVTLFENTKPKLTVLEKVYRKLQTIVIEQRKRTRLQNNQIHKLCISHENTASIHCSTSELNQKKCN